MDTQSERHKAIQEIMAVAAEFVNEDMMFERFESTAKAILVAAYVQAWFGWEGD